MAVSVLTPLVTGDRLANKHTQTPGNLQPKEKGAAANLVPQTSKSHDFGKRTKQLRSSKHNLKVSAGSLRLYYILVAADWPARKANQS